MDSADHWRRVEELFYAALDLDPQARPAFLQQACESDTGLLQEVEALLESAGKSMDFLPQAVLEVAHKMTMEGRHEMIATGTELAHYKIISLLGAGGMGEVYLAEDMRLRRKVALKMLAPELIQC